MIADPRYQAILSVMDDNDAILLFEGASGQAKFIAKFRSMSAGDLGDAIGKMRMILEQQRISLREHVERHGGNTLDFDMGLAEGESAKPDEGEHLLIDRGRTP